MADHKSVSQLERKMSAGKFLQACRAGDTRKAVRWCCSVLCPAALCRMYESEAAVLNYRDRAGYTGLMWAVLYQQVPCTGVLCTAPYRLQYSLVARLLQLPGLDTDLSNEDGRTGLHLACQVQVLFHALGTH